MGNTTITVKNILDKILSSYSINSVQTYDMEIKADKGVYFIKVQTSDNKIEKIKIIKN